jgi:signal transduction histidine kinase
MRNTTNGARPRPEPWVHWMITAVAVGAGLAGLMVGRRVQKALRPPVDPTCERQHTTLREHAARQARAARQLDHDMRAPVGAMAVALELVQTTDDPMVREEAMQVLVRQVARMTTLTQRLHEISQDFNG